MMNWILALILLVSAAQLAFLCIFLLKLRRVYEDVLDFVSPGENSTPSQLGVEIQKLANYVGLALGREFKTSLMGKASVESRQAKAAEGELAVALAQQSPKLNGLMSLFPHLAKLIQKNPAILGAIDQFAPSLTGGNGGSPSEPKGQSEFDFNK